MAPEKVKKEITAPPSYMEAGPSNKKTKQQTCKDKSYTYEKKTLGSEYKDHALPEHPVNFDGYYEFEENTLLEKNPNNPVYKIQNVTVDCCNKHSKLLSRGTLFLLFVAYTVYFSFAVNYSVQKSIALIVITCIVVALIIYVFIRDHFGEAIYQHFFRHIETLMDKNWYWIKW